MEADRTRQGARMSQPDQQAPEQAPAQPEQQEPDRAPDLAAEAEKWKALARKHEMEAKANKAAAAKLAEFEDRDKTEAQKLAERAEAAERELLSLRLESARSQVALEKGLTATQARRLIGATVEELTADADLMLAEQGPPAIPSFDGGARTSPPQGADMNAFIRRAAGRT